MDNTVKLGKNVKIRPNVELHYVTVGDNVVIGKNTTIFGSPEHQVVIGDNVYISPNCYFNGAFGLIIGNDVTFSLGATIFTDSGPNVGPLKNIYPTEESEIHVEDGCWIGAYGVLLPGAEMKKCSVLATHSTLKTMIPEYEVYGGNYAKYIKKNDRVL